MMFVIHCWMGSKRFQNNLENMILLLINKAWLQALLHQQWFFGLWKQENRVKGGKENIFAFYTSVLWVFLKSQTLLFLMWLYYNLMYLL